MGIDGAFGRSQGCIFFQVVASGEVFFEPDIKDDEEVAVAHFFDFELGEAGAADAGDDFAAVGFEGVGGVVEAVAEEDSDEEVGEAVEEEFDGGG